MFTKPLGKRLYEKIIVHPRNRCWIWTGAVADCGYGILEMLPRRRPERAHRLSWTYHNGPIPAGMKVLHRCDRPACINPDHLFLGTQVDNLNDMKAKGRGRLPKGIHHPFAKLTEAQVREIRKASGVTQRELANKYRVGQDMISRIRARKIWKDVG